MRGGRGFCSAFGTRIQVPPFPVRYACITPHTTKSADIVLPYPDSDPQSHVERFGFSHRADSSVEEGPPPRGRSFHNSRFVHQLRRIALAEPLVSVYCGRATGLVRSGAPATTLTRSVPPPPRFAGYDADSRPIPSPRPVPSPGKPDAGHACTPPTLPRTVQAEQQQQQQEGIVGVAWVDEHGHEQVSRAPLTIVCDGRYSTLRAGLTTEQPRTISFMVGLLLRHPAGTGDRGILPYPRRGHVILADPSVILLYQISSTETRALVDVPAPLPSVEDGSLQRRVAPPPNTAEARLEQPIFTPLPMSPLQIPPRKGLPTAPRRRAAPIRRRSAHPGARVHTYQIPAYRRPGRALDEGRAPLGRQLEHAAPVRGRCE